MKKSELKNVLKPLIKECVKEVLLEENVLSNVVSEVVIGLKPLLTENKSLAPFHQNNTAPELEQASISAHKEEQLLEKQRMIKEQKIKILNATGFGSEIFEGVDPISSAGAPSESPSHGALSGVDPSDAGVDITGIMALGGHKWDKLV